MRPYEILSREPTIAKYRAVVLLLLVVGAECLAVLAYAFDLGLHFGLLDVAVIVACLAPAVVAWRILKIRSARRRESP